MLFGVHSLVFPTFFLSLALSLSLSLTMAQMIGGAHARVIVQGNEPPLYYTVS